MDRPRFWEATRRRVIARDMGVCGICHRPGATTVDHIVPRVLGGLHEDANLRAAHLGCNSRLGGVVGGQRRRARVMVTLPSARASRW